MKRGAILASVAGLANAIFHSEYDDVCSQIEAAISDASDVYYPLQSDYEQDVKHWMTSSAERAGCSVQPGTAEDVSAILSILGTTRTPFAVKGGGHASNSGFSSTEGVQISMTRFADVDFDEDAQTATIGTGLYWDDVYAALVEPHGVNVVGGRVTGVGMAGFTLGGGYSWKSNQHGLTIDTATQYELVKPTGEIVTVTEDSDSELFFGLKGGLNNFGIVTRITLKTFPQDQVWGGLITFTFNVIDQVTAATADFSANNNDPKANIITAYNFLLGQPGISQLLFYDGPTPPAGLFDAFLAIPHLTEDVKTRSYPDAIDTFGAGDPTAGQRGAFHSVPLRALSTPVLDALVNESVFWGNKLSLLDSGTFFSYDAEPFLPSTWNQNTAETGYPPESSRSQSFLPLNIYFAWQSSLADETFQDAVRSSAAQIRAVAEADGQTGLADAPIYPNYAIAGTSLENMYGENVDRLRALKQLVDPEDVMGLAGGFKF